MPRQTYRVQIDAPASASPQYVIRESDSPTLAAWATAQEWGYGPWTTLIVQQLHPETGAVSGEWAYHNDELLVMTHGEAARSRTGLRPLG